MGQPLSGSWRGHRGGRGVFVEYGTRPDLPPSSVPDSDDALLKMTISQQEFGRPGLPDLSSMTEEEQIAYAMQMSLQGAGESPGGQAGHVGWAAQGLSRLTSPPQSLARQSRRTSMPVQPWTRLSRPR